MDLVKEISMAVILLIRVGCSMRLIYCLIRLSATEEESSKYKKRAKNSVIFYILAESIWQIKDLIIFYYK